MKLPVNMLIKHRAQICDGLLIISNQVKCRRRPAQLILILSAKHPHVSTALLS